MSSTNSPCAFLTVSEFWSTFYYTNKGLWDTGVKQSIVSSSWLLQSSPLYNPVNKYIQLHPEAVMFLVSTYLGESLLQNLDPLKAVRIFALISIQILVMASSYSLIPFLPLSLCH